MRYENLKFIVMRTDSTAYGPDAIGEEVEKRVGAIIDERHDEIVEMAVKRVYDSITHRKPFREACKKMDIIFGGLGGDEDGEA